MTDFVLPASLFSDDPVERDVVLNQAEIDEVHADKLRLLSSKDANDQAEGDLMYIPEPKIIRYFLLPVTATIDAEYTKRRGHNEQHLRFRPSQGDEGKPSIEFEPMDRMFSNERELSALKWIAKKVIKGWRAFKNSEGQDVGFSELNLERLSEYPQYIRPAIDEAYKIADLKTEVEEKNSET